MKQEQIEAAVAALKIPTVTACVKKMQGDTPDGWGKMTAKAKREHLVGVVQYSNEKFQSIFKGFAADAGIEVDEIDESLAAEPEHYVHEAAPATVPQESTEIATAGAQLSAPHTTVVSDLVAHAASEVAGLSAKDSLANLQEAYEHLEEYHFRIGALLSHMQATEAYLTLGYANMRELITSTTRLEYRKAMYLAANAAKIMELQIPESALQGVTWTKLRDVLPVLTAENYEGWLELARTDNSNNLNEAVQAAKVAALGAPEESGGDEGESEGGGEAVPAPPTKQRGFLLYVDQDAMVQQALDKAKVEGNVDTNGAALAVIATAYTGAPAPATLEAEAGPDISDEHVRAICEAAKKKEKAGSFAELIRVLNVIGAVWPEVDINVDTEPEG